MDRLTLMPKPRIVERRKCLPAGDGLPGWKSLPLYSKFPMVQNPKGSVKLCTTKLCEPVHKALDFAFDLSDPYCHLMSNNYQPLHDPHLKNHFSKRRKQRHLRKHGFITEKGKVVCNLKEFNQYRQYLHKICLLEIAKEQRARCQELADRKLRRTSQGDGQERPESRGKQIRRRLQQMREEAKLRIQREVIQKEEKLGKRLEDLTRQKGKRQHNILQRRHTSAAENHDRLTIDNQTLTRNWKRKEKLRLSRLEEMKRNKLLLEQQKSVETWNLRKKEQIRRMAAEMEQRKKEETRKEKSVSARNRKLSRHREKLRAKLEQIQRQSREEREEIERQHRQRLTKRLVLLRLRMANRGRGRRGLHKGWHESIWTLEDTLQQILVSDIPFSGKKSTGQFLTMFNEILDSEISKIGEDEPGYTNEKEIQTKAKEIVSSVIHKVKTDMYPAYVKMRSEEEIGHVTFGPDATIPPNRMVDRSKLLSVKDHVLTPVPSPATLHKLIMLDRSCEIKLMESLLHRLLEDLNRNRLTDEEVRELSRYAMDIVSSRLHGESRHDISKIADDVVEFTLKKVLSDIRTGITSQEELTHMAATIVSHKRESNLSELSVSSDDDELQRFIDDTIESIVKNHDLDRVSSVQDAILDEWIMITLKEILDDINHNWLSKAAVLKMVSAMTRNDSRHEDIQTMSVPQVLERVINNLDRGDSTLLFKVVHAVVSSYHAYKVETLESVSELIQLIIEKLRQAISDEELPEFEIYFSKIQNATKRLTSTALRYVQLSEVATVIHDVFKKPKCATSASNQTVESVIKNAKNTVLLANCASLKRYMKEMTLALQKLSAVNMKDEDRTKADESFQENVTNFAVRVLEVVRNSLECGDFTAEDIQEFLTIVAKDILPADGTSKEKLFTKHVSELLSAFKSGHLDPQELLELEISLIQCGNRLLQGRETFSSPNIARKPSLTSSAVASDVLTHILYSIQDEMHKGLITKEAIKELAMCILKASKNVSPTMPDSKIEFAKGALKEMLSDMELENERGHAVLPVAMSKMFSGEHKKKVEKIAENVVQLLQKDCLTRGDLKRIFSILFQHYISAAQSEIQVSDDLMNTDSQLASSVVKKTLRKIERDIESGRLSSEEVLSIVDDSADEHKLNIQNHLDIVNLTLAVLQQFLSDISNLTTAKDFVKQFLSIAFEVDVPSEESVATSSRIQEIMKDIRKNGNNSVHILTMARAFSSKKVYEEKGTSKTDALLLQRAIQNVQPDFITNFIRFTIQTLIGDCINHHKEERESVQQGQILESVSSSVAIKVVDSLLSQIERGLRDDNTEHLPSIDAHSSKQEFSNIPSETMNALILDTMNNIISNLRQESSRELDHENLETSESEMIHDFVLDKLHDIVGSMQGKVVDLTPDKEKTESPSKYASILIDEREAKRVISGSLRNVIGEITTDMEQMKGKNTDNSESTEAETLVIQSLQKIIQQYEKDRANTLSGKEREIKKHILFVLKSFRNDMHTDKRVHTSLQNIFRPILVLNQDEHDNDQLIESTLDQIIENVNTDSIRVSDLLEKNYSGDGDKTPSQSYANGMDRPSLSLQKMTDMTREMASLYDDMYPSNQGVHEKESDYPIAERIASDVQIIAEEALERTIDNIENGRLSQEEMQTLVSAITANEEDLSFTQMQHTDSLIEDMILKVLKNLVEELRISGIDPKDLPEVTKNIFQVNSNKEMAEDSSGINASGVPSEVITDMVTTVLSKLANNLSEESVKMDQSNQETIPTSVSNKSGIEKKKTQDNVNPNASIKQSSVHSLLDDVGPQKQTTPTPVVHSSHEIRNKGREKHDQVKERANGNLNNKAVTKHLVKTSPNKKMGHKMVDRTCRPPIAGKSPIGRKIEPSTKKVESAYTPKKSFETAKKRNVASSTNRRSKEKQNSQPAGEKPSSPNARNKTTTDDMPSQVYSLWGSFKLAIKNVKKK